MPRHWGGNQHRPKHSQPGFIVQRHRKPAPSRKGCFLVVAPVFGAVVGVILAVFLLAGCEMRPGGPPANYESPRPPVPNSRTKEVCDKTVRAYFDDRLGTDAAKTELRNLANTPGVDGKVRSAIIDGLYAKNQLPESPEQLENRYRLVVSACRRTGWE